MTIDLAVAEELEAEQLIVNGRYRIFRPDGGAKYYTRATCSVPDCEGKSYCRGWCVMHYTRWRRTGKLEANGNANRKRRSLRDRFEDRVDRSGEGCWLWTGCLSRGYGQIWIGPKAFMAHRVSYELYVGEIPDGLHLDHLCRVKLCVNPAHLEPVTAQVNTRRYWESKS